MHFEMIRKQISAEKSIPLGHQTNLQTDWRRDEKFKCRFLP